MTGDNISRATNNKLIANATMISNIVAALCSETIIAAILSNLDLFTLL
jgi:hypothetical protein